MGVTKFSQFEITSVLTMDQAPSSNLANILNKVSDFIISTHMAICVTATVLILVAFIGMIVIGQINGNKRQECEQMTPAPQTMSAQNVMQNPAQERSNLDISSSTSSSSDNPNQKTNKEFQLSAEPNPHDEA
ncbi:hypothetical protein OUZ56_001168 [Daphnia magna]|uniref:Uncharacterized protein n=1 Tax=Daphnia magna TaxID=35525 RepID=A0ABR0A1V6_9CRUS|nr:hypothetical protein OUZ56_001168 [Daphnia magna]